MSDIRVIEISSRDQFRAVAKEFGVKIADRGALPKRQLLVAVREAVKAGKAQLIETDFFGVDALLSAPVKTARRGALVWTITFRAKDAETGKLGDPSKVDITAEQIRKVLPDANFQGAKLSNVVAVVMLGALEGASIAELANYVITDVVRKDDSDAEASEDTPKGDDTGEDTPDADKASEGSGDAKPVEQTAATDEGHASEEMINAAITAGENSVKADMPELVPAESAPKPAPKRTRKPAAKAANK